MVAPNAVTATRDELTALRIDIPVASISAGTMRNPPPIPKKPDSIPVASPRPPTAGKFDQLRWTPGAPMRERVRNIMMALALTLHIDPVFVGAHHLSRFVFVSVATPGIVHLFGRPQEDVDD